ncbi:cytochrome P450 [Archangium lipolyticum]|uniref:cytochrome P450 n=1 Tax=Archangium lipolyticum TaxID=2970465 RepID=UPI002DD6B6B5|nr:cytochrome P450 [Archangium lipolyticum]
MGNTLSLRFSIVYEGGRIFEPVFDESGGAAEGAGGQGGCQVRGEAAQPSSRCGPRQGEDNDESYQPDGARSSRESRIAASDITLSGVTVPRGAMVFPLLSSANRDERKFPDPDRFDLHRGSPSHDLQPSPPA